MFDSDRRPDIDRELRSQPAPVPGKRVVLLTAPWRGIEEFTESHLDGDALDEYEAQRRRMSKRVLAESFVGRISAIPEKFEACLRFMGLQPLCRQLTFVIILFNPDFNSYRLQLLTNNQNNFPINIVPAVNSNSQRQFLHPFFQYTIIITIGPAGCS